MKTITTHDELEALPPGAVVRDSDGITDADLAAATRRRRPRHRGRK